MRRSAPVPLALLALACCAGLAPAEVGAAVSFRCERDLFPARPGANRAEVDVALLAGSATDSPRLADLRLFAPAGAEVAYLLIEPTLSASEQAATSILPIQPTKTESGFEADLGAILSVDRLRVAGLPAPFLKRVRVEASGDRAHWTVIEPEGTLFDLPAEQLRRTEIELPTSELRYFRVTWNDASSGRVPLPTTVLARRVQGGQPPPQLRSPLAFERRTAEPGRSRFRVRLPAPRLPIVAFELLPAGGHVMREAAVTEARLEGGEVRPVRLGRATLRRSEQAGAVAAELRIPVAAPLEAEVEIEIEDGDNPPLDLVEVAALFAPQPWLYFESEDGKPLVARFGAAGLTPPRYDLEAVREVASAERDLPLARWGEMRERPEAEPTTEGEALFSGGAPIDSRRFRLSRTLAPGPPGLTTLPLDLAVLAESPTLADVRLVTADGLQVPYLMETLAERLVVDLPSPKRLPETARCGLERERGERWSCYLLELPAPSLPAGLFSLHTEVRAFARRVLLRRGRHEPRAGVEIGRPRRDEAFVTVFDGTWSHADPERAPRPLTINLPSLPTRELYLAIEEGDNSPLPLSEPRLYLPAFRLRFFRPGDSELRLLYGGREQVPPRYDLALLAPRLLGASAAEASMAAASAPVSPGRFAQSSRIFWVVLVVAVIVLLLLIGRLVASGARSEDTPGTE